MTEIQEYAQDLVVRLFGRKGTRLAMYDSEMKKAYRDLEDMGKGTIKSGRYFPL